MALKKRTILALLIGLAVAALFTWLASRNIEAQGLYQDEVLQASGSFAYVGRSPTAFLSVLGVPVLTNSYLAAIKTGIYGVYMRVMGRPFTIVSWRMVGILAVALGLFVFSVLARRTLGPWSLLLGLLLVITDGSVIIMTRHDWGPTALALLIRLAVIAMLLRDEPDEAAARRNCFVVGALVGVGVFEKLSSLVLLAPVALAIAVEPFRRRRRALAALVAGGLAGGFPLIAVNAITLVRDHRLISIADADSSLRPPLKDFVRAFPDQFLSLGAGAFTRSWILGDTNSAPERDRETALMAALLAVTMAIAAWKFRDRAEFRTAAVLALSVFGVAAMLYAMPRPTAAHHHVQAIPFTYIAGALALAGLARLKRFRAAEKAAAGVLAALMLLLLANHASTVMKIEADFAAGKAGVDWDRTLTRLGEFGASKRRDATFILTDWGVATPMFCLAQGQPGLINEVFWDYHGPQDLEAVAEKAGARTVYVVSPVRIGIDAQKSARINRDAGALANWKEAPLEPEAASLRPFVVARKFDVAPRR